MAIRAAAQETIIDITDAYSVYLTCASYTFPGTTSGAKAGSCATSVVAMRGTDQVPTSVDPSRVAAAAGVSVKASANGDGSTALSVSVTPDVKAPGKVSIPVTVDGRAEFTLEFSYGIALTGATGATGNGVKSIAEQYYLSTSSSSQVGGSWEENPPAWADGKYMWTRSVITYTDNSSTQTTPVCVTGARGQTGQTGGTGATGVGVSSVDVQYYLSTSPEALSGGSWQSEPPAWADGKYMWSKTVTTYTTGASDETSPVCITGAKGATGAKGDKGDPGDDFGGAGRLDTLETLVRSSGEGVEVARKVNGNYTSTKAIVTDADYQIVSKGGDVLARYGSDKIEIGKSTAVSKIDMGGDNLTFSFTRNQGSATSIDAHENDLTMSAATIYGYARGGSAVIQSSGGTSVGSSSIILSPPYAEHTSNGNVVPYKGSRITLYAEDICLKDDPVSPGDSSSVDVVAPLYVKWTKIWASGGQQVRYCVRMGICFLQFALSSWTGEWKCPAKIPSKYAPAVSSYFGVARTQNATSSVWVGSDGDLYFYSYDTATVMTGTVCWPIG